ncbi:21578_t:CDS:2, partial [Rhizophagus irregularis]
MENQSSFKVYTAIEITNPVDVGKLIGHKGCNLKPIATRTGTNIHRIKEAIYQMMQLVEDLTKKEEKKVRFSDDDNHQHVPPKTPPRNQRDLDSKERRNNFNQETSYATNSRQ